MWCCEVYANNLTYCIENPPNCAVSTAHQDPVLLKISEETQTERNVKDILGGSYVGLSKYSG